MAFIAGAEARKIFGAGEDSASLEALDKGFAAFRDLVGVGAEEAPAESFFGRRRLKVEQRSQVRIKSKQREARADKLAEALGRGDAPLSDGSRGGQGREKGLKRI